MSRLNEDSVPGSIQHHQSKKSDYTADSGSPNRKKNVSGMRPKGRVDVHGSTSVDIGAATNDISHEDLVKSHTVKGNFKKSRKSVLPKLINKLREEQDSLVSYNDDNVTHGGSSYTADDKNQKGKSRKRQVSVKPPQWRDRRLLEKLGRATLERFATQLQYRQTLLHI